MLWEVILSVIGALGLREFLPLVFSSVFKRKEEVEASKISNIEKLEYGNREQILFLKQQLSEAYEELDKTQDFLNKKRSIINELSRRLYVLELELEKLKKEKENFFCINTFCNKRIQN